jgi:anti-sigma factor RsiW
MITCTDAERLIVRFVDATLGEEDRAVLAAHVEGCAACRRVLDDQREVFQILHARDEAPVPPSFAARVAARIRSEEVETHGDIDGWLGLANWRRWTVALAPLAATLVLIVYLEDGASVSNSAATQSQQVPPAVSLDLWPAAGGSTPAAAFLQPASSGDVLLETVLTGAVPATSGDAPNVR